MIYISRKVYLIYLIFYYTFIEREKRDAKMHAHINYETHRSFFEEFGDSFRDVGISRYLQPRGTEGQLPDESGELLLYARHVTVTVLVIQVFHKVLHSSHN